MTSHNCMIRCVQKPACMAFNHSQQAGQCVLILKETCLIPNITPQWKHVSLYTCQKRAPWRSKMPRNNGWNWTQLEDAKTGNNIIALTSDRYVGRLFYKGLYLPGWGRNDKIGLRAINPIEKKKVLGVQLAANISPWMTSWSMSGSPLMRVIMCLKTLF